MPVTIKSKTQKKAAPAKAAAHVNPLVEELREEIEEHISIVAQIKDLKAQLSVLESSKKTIEEKAVTLVEANYNDEDVVELLLEHGHGIKVGAVGSKRAISDKEGLFEALEAVEEGLVFELANINLGDIDKYLSAHEQEKYISKEQTKRTVTAK